MAAYVCVDIDGTASLQKWDASRGTISLCDDKSGKSGRKAGCELGQSDDASIGYVVGSVSIENLVLKNALNLGVLLMTLPYFRFVILCHGDDSVWIFGFVIKANYQWIRPQYWELCWSLCDLPVVDWQREDKIWCGEVRECRFLVWLEKWIKDRDHTSGRKKSVQDGEYSSRGRVAYCLIIGKILVISVARFRTLFWSRSMGYLHRRLLERRIQLWNSSAADWCQRIELSTSDQRADIDEIDILKKYLARREGLC